MRHLISSLLLVMCAVCGAKASAQETPAEESTEVSGVIIGGYGEVHLNAVFPDESIDSRPPPTLDFHRFVLLFGYQFDERWSFFSELELEHNWVQGGTSIEASQTGYLVLEQAYLQYIIRRELVLRGGIILLPVGLLNENHEPSRFNTVERPVYHNQIIPTTWFGTGIALGGELFDGTVRYDLTLTEGLNDRQFSRNSAIRNGRQRGFYATLDNLFTTLRVDFIGLPGLIVGGSVSVNWNVSDRDEDNPHIYERTVLSELHLAYNGNGIRSSIEFADIAYTPKDDSDASAVEPTRSQGLTAEVGYDVLRPLRTKETSLYPFVRFSRLNPAGSLKNNTAAYNRLDAGLAFLPIRRLAIKADFGRNFYEDDSRNVSFINGGIGYEF